ncbi:MAG: cysteine--tRNA ligase [Clostridia bacterium]|nr:cysteine--tRNA ligase [Clostridia bacterium]
MFFYNTLTRKKEKFIPLKEKEVKMYSCGPTVYKDATIGNMRTNIFQDVLRRVLKYNGYKLTHAMNITDVGHLVSDGDEGEDKMLKSAREENKSPLEIAKHYTELFFKDLELLNIETPEIVCKATDHIQEMLEFVKELVEKGYAYETSTAIYFDISKLDKYPVLSNVNIEDQKAGARVDVDIEKRSPYDFALWIKAPKEHLMKWESPWGLSYPGWHIECSAMGRKYLGDQFDIHTGGIDLIPTHHENEIAQSKGITGKIPANYWMHGEYLLIDGGKMSKSLGNVYLIKDFINRGYDPITFKLFSYSCHYKNKLNFTWEGIESATKSLERLRNGYRLHLQGNDEIDENEVNQYEERFHQAINDDLNMPLAMGVVWEVVRNENKTPKLAKLLEKFDTVLGIEIEKQEEIEIPEEIIEIAEKRKQAREVKDWAKSDELRDLIDEKGYIIKDKKDGYEIIKK